MEGVWVVEIAGNTYPRRRELAARGAVWSPRGRCYLYRMDGPDCPRGLEMEEWARGQGLAAGRRMVPAAELEPEGYAEERQRKQARAAARADKHREIAARQDATAEALRAGVPGADDHAYHFQPAAPNSALGRQRARDARALDRAYSAAMDAKGRRDRADGLERMATPDNERSLAFVTRRIAEAEAAARLLARRIDAAQPVELDRLRAMKAKQDEKAQHWRDVLREIGAGSFGPHNVRPGDLVRVRGQWYVVRRANRKTVTLDSEFDLKRVYGEIEKLHLRKEDNNRA